MSRNRFVKLGGIIPLEVITGSISTVDTNHVQVHEGHGFVPVIEVALTSSQVYDILLSLPSDKYVHFQSMSLQSLSGRAKVEIYKDAVYASFSDDSSITPQNRNHHANTTSGVEFMSNQSPTSDGTLVDTLAVAAGGRRTSGNGGDSGEPEMVLKPSTLMLLRITNIESAANTIIFKPFWYEEDEG